MKYTINDLINKIHTSERIIAIYCETEEEAKLTINILYSHHIYWDSDVTGVKNLTYFGQYKNKKGIVYWVDNEYGLKITHSSIEYALKIIEDGCLTDLVEAKDIKFNLQNW